MNGFLIIDKPIGKTSFDMVYDARKKLQERRVGHVGTLDPFASGLLIVAVGTYTKLFFLFDDLEKEYIASGVFGESKNTDDNTGTILNLGLKDENIEKEDIIALLKNSFTGDVLQKPPMFSAKHVDGKRAYHLARAGIDFELKSVPVSIYNIELLNYNYPSFDIKMSVSKGTYIRSIIRDIGEHFKHLAYTDGLIRIRIGRYGIDNCSEISANNLLSFSDMFSKNENIIIEVIKDNNFRDKLLTGNTQTIENIEIDEKKYIAFIDKDDRLIAMIRRGTDFDKTKNAYAYVSDKKIFA